MSAEIDWEKQWATHAPEFREGKAHIRLPSNDTIELLPGPGFGDFSHPTTQLMVDIMTCFVRDEVVFDIGCGSGILTIASAKMGAKQNFACDIDQNALMHTLKNAANSQVNVKIGAPEDKPLILMNMIASEQKVAWQENKRPFKTLITSGILNTEKKDYLTYAFDQGWQLISEAHFNSWLAFVFKEKS